MDDNKSTGYTQGKILLLRFTSVDFYLEIPGCFDSFDIVVIISDVAMSLASPHLLPSLIYFCACREQRPDAARVAGAVPVIPAGGGQQE